MVSYNESIYFDRAFYAEDIRGSIGQRRLLLFPREILTSIAAYARANVKTGILTQNEFETIQSGLEQVLEEWEKDKFVIKPGVDEDIHSANERSLNSSAMYLV